MSCTDYPKLFYVFVTFTQSPEKGGIPVKEDTLAELAKKLNISKSTVSKAVRHCSGVDSETRQLILDAVPRGSASSEKDFPVYTIFPDTPQYFWKDLLRGFMDGEDRDSFPAKHNIYTRITDEDTVLRYLDEAEKMDIRVLAIAAYVTPEIQRRLLRLQERCMILFVSEFCPMVNTFYVGANAYRDGYAMGEAFLRHHAHRRPVYFSVLDNGNAEQRTRGFFDAVRAVSPETAEAAIPLSIDNTLFRDLKMLSSRVASLLSAGIVQCGDYCVYSPVGMTSQLANAFKKAGLYDIVCMCHDCFTEDMTVPDGFSICCNQDVYAQGYAAARTALAYVRDRVYPAEKTMYIPSKLRQQN